MKLPNILRMFNFTFSLAQKNKAKNLNCERKSSHVRAIFSGQQTFTHLRICKFVINKN